MRFEAFPAEPFEARVSYIYPTVSLESRTGRVRLELENSTGRLRPGMYAQVRLTGEAEQPTVVVPRSALLETGERALVFVEAGDGTLVPRAVTPGRVEGREVEILSGLQAGDRIVSSAAFLVDAESNLGSLLESGEMEGMEGMDGMEGGAGAMDGMDGMGDMEGMDHSEHVMPAPDTVDHSQHVMPAPDTVDHSQHVMPAPVTVDHSGLVMPPPDTSRAAGAGRSSHPEG